MQYKNEKYLLDTIKIQLQTNILGINKETASSYELGKIAQAEQILIMIKYAECDRPFQKGCHKPFIAYVGGK